MSQTEAFFRHMVSAVEDYAIYALDRHGVITTWNLGAQRLKGFSEREAVGMHYAELYTAEDVAAGRPQRALALAAERGRYEEEGWRARKDGSRFWAHIVLTAITDETGALLGFTKVTRDLSERREYEDKLHHANANLERLAPQFEAAGFAIPVVTGAAAVTGSWDRSRVEQVLENLLVNALRYGKRRPVEVFVDHADASARLCVRDHGMGIAPQDVDRIFLRWERGGRRSSTSGLGLGLYIARQIVDAHGGTIRARSPGLDAGATFIVELPRATGSLA